MKRFRLTLLLICLLLLWLGGRDLSLLWRNPAPESLSVQQLLSSGPSREWVRIVDGFQVLDEAISTSGTLELDALLIPVKRDPTQQRADLFIESRDPQLLSLFSTYHFQLDSEQEKQSYRKAHADEFVRRQPVSGMLISGLTAENNRRNLAELAGSLDMAVRPDVIFVAAGKQPGGLRGYLFVAAALLGLGKLISMMRKPGESVSKGNLKARTTKAGA